MKNSLEKKQETGKTHKELENKVTNYFKLTDGFNKSRTELKKESMKCKTNQQKISNEQ